jgi:hypothetical protein
VIAEARDAVEGALATAAGCQPAACAAAAVVGPIATSAGLTDGGQTWTSSSSTAGLATTSMVAVDAAARAFSALASIVR